MKPIRMGMKTKGNIQLWYGYGHKKIRSDLRMKQLLSAVHFRLVLIPSFIKRRHRVKVISIQLQI
ncbi:hypothetical protein BHY07_10825 [Bacillus subtilis subsp. subtilis]|nr:hypothetical protein BSn5_01210 [Bacillus subtilis BSn5]AIY93290.1 hypothetical protein QU35_10845 [Bacillus subtilis subsp. subtilis str. 168]AIY97597.1 hypothetical protein QX56_10835 [Bacillus subtilis]AJE94670.1 hypothetical protein RP72_10725 [Bacillus subtilis subsp. subtilis]AKC47545.1 hypothetical protein O7A_10835 [Bacillus subtilis KCTC 1028 = ATCC 6051a]AOL27156.1 hypothetical protein BGM23_11410 [Bacillus sp. FJAT-14266]AOL29918.1 hypothetical protein BGM20_04440 [Alkalicoccoba